MVAGPRNQRYLYPPPSPAGVPGAALQQAREQMATTGLLRTSKERSRVTAPWPLDGAPTQTSTAAWICRVFGLPFKRRLKPGSAQDSREMPLTPKTYRRACLACTLTILTLVLLAPSAARADFFDSARRTFQTDIPHFFTTDFPHFFQDDIPCAFGFQPTSHTKTSCKSSASPVKPATHANPTTPPPAQPSSGQ